MSNDYAIRVKDVSKVYKLYDRNKDRVLDAFGIGRKKRYTEHYALHDISFDVKRGESIGIIGTNGAGKSTMLKIITGVLSPTGGEVEIDGRISALLELGAGFNMEYTGIENIYLNGTMMGFSKEEVDARLQSILDFADIGDFVYQPVKSYSSGMFVRLAFAVAINIDPEILIVDEALSVGDVFFQAKCYKKFDEFKQAGKTILFVSHDLSSISKYCDRVLLFNKGQMMSEGNPKEMIALYKRILAAQKDEGETKSSVSVNGSQGKNLAEILGHSEKEDASKTWMSHYRINPDVDEYGNGSAAIIDFAVVDEEGVITSSIEKGTTFTIKEKVRFDKKLQDPIFTYTFKNLKGVNVTGTNSMFEGASVGEVNPGDVVEATFSQEMNLQGGEYLLSISCTGYTDGDFQVYHRLYDVINITVISSKDTVGFYDMNSQVGVRKL